MNANGNGFRIRGWRDLGAVVALVILTVSIIASTVVWITMIDNRGETNANRLTRIETRSEARPDPFTGSEGRALENRVDALERRLEAME